MRIALPTILLLGFATAAHADFLIDDFSSAISLTTSTSAPVYSSSSITGSATYDRMVGLYNYTNPFGNPANINISNKFASFNQGAAVASIGTLAYGCQASTDHSTYSLTPMGLDLTKYSAFDLRVLLNGADTQVKLTLDAVNTYNFTLKATSTPQDYIINFSNFGAQNFKQVDEIMFTFTNPATNDFVLGGFTATPAPEPAGLILLGLPVLGLLAFKRR